MKLSRRCASTEPDAFSLSRELPSFRRSLLSDGGTPDVSNRLATDARLPGPVCRRRIRGKDRQGPYASSQTALRTARTKEELAPALNTFAPEWVGNMPAGETLTFADLTKEAEAVLAIPPEKRPLPKMDFVYIRKTGWNVLAVYWSSRRSDTRDRKSTRLN